MTTKTHSLVTLVALAALTSACGVAEQGRSPSLVRLNALEASPGGAQSATYSGFLLSDVSRVVTVNSQQVATIFNDNGRVTLSLVMKDPAVTPSNLNAVTFTHYRVTYRRTDGRNTEGVDVPYSFDSGVSLTVLNDTAVSVGFELVRSSAKAEAPLRALVSNGEVISTIATVTFYGHDQANKGVEVTGTIGIDFANFADN